MKAVTNIFAIVYAGAGILVAETSAGQDPHVGIGAASVPVVRHPAECGTLLLNADGDYEAGLNWQYNGVQAPYYGAMAECYSGEGEICSAILDLTRTQADLPSATLDAFIWDDNGGQPGSVRCVALDMDPGAVEFWPLASRHAIPLPDGCCVESSWWVGYWPNWPGMTARWLTTADVTGTTHCPLTNIAPGIGYPTGWSNVSIVWGPHNALGIGAEMISCNPTPIRSSTWGAVKTLYSR